jgi:hypothetical protein
MNIAVGIVRIPMEGQIVRIGKDDHSIEILRDDNNEYQKQQEQTTATMEAIDEL